MQTGELNNMMNELLGIQFSIEKANRTDGKVQNLACFINENTLAEAHHRMSRNKAKGIDGVGKDEYETSLSQNLKLLLNKMKKGSYRPKPIRRVLIPKDNGKMRPLGISCYEDKLVEYVIAEILIMVYEPKFYNCSYGFRPDRNCHQAVKEVIEDVQYHKTNYVVEADIKGFFDNVNHEWLMKFLKHDIADRCFLDLINKFLKAGIMINGKLEDSETGTPQGNGASPVLANIYLHYVLDNWFDVKIRSKYKGETYLIRYCDDFVCCFQNIWEAQKFYRELNIRFDKYSLELALEKTRILEFGRFAEKRRIVQGYRKAETFDFLGFTFYCSSDRKKEYFRCKVKTSKKKFRKKVKEMSQWVKEHRNLPVGEIIKGVNIRLRGHYQYYCVNDNQYETHKFFFRTKWILFYWLNRRSEKRSYTWDEFYNGLLRTLPLVVPSLKVSLFNQKLNMI